MKKTSKRDAKIELTRRAVRLPELGGPVTSRGVLPGIDEERPAPAARCLDVPRDARPPLTSAAEQVTQIVVVRKATWWIHHGGINGNDGLTGQLTEVRLRATGEIFYVREHLRGIDHFTMHGNARLGMKEGRAPAGSWEVLELLAPAERWEDLSLLVQTIDADPKYGRARPVVRPRRTFTARWVVEAFASAARGRRAAS